MLLNSITLSISAILVITFLKPKPDDIVTINKNLEKDRSDSAAISIYKLTKSKASLA